MYLALFYEIKKAECINAVHKIPVYYKQITFNEAWEIPLNNQKRMGFFHSKWQTSEPPATGDCGGRDPAHTKKEIKKMHGQQICEKVVRDWLGI